MAFNFDNEINRLSRLPREAQGWLREIFLKDWGLKVIALVVTLVLWFGVTGQRTPTNKNLSGIKLSFSLPSNMDISNDYRNGVDIKISGDKSDIARLDERSLVATVDVSDYLAGEHLIQLTTKNVSLDLPTGVKLEGITPNAVFIRLEPHVEKEIVVEPQLTGKPAEGFEVIAAEVDPVKIKISGPENHIKVLEKAFTAKISLDGLRSDYTVTRVAIDIRDEKVFIADEGVAVKIRIGEQRVEKTFDHVSVRTGSGEVARPETVSVTLYGEKSVLEKLRAEDLTILLDVAADGAITPRLILPQGIQGRIELRSTKPAGFSIDK